MAPQAASPSSARLIGPLTAAAGVLLAAVTLLQATHLRNLSLRVRRAQARAEMRGLGEGLRWRLERDLVLRDLNTPATERALREMVADSDSLRWAALYEPEGRRLAEGGPAVRLSPDQLAVATTARRGGLPAVQELSDGELLGLTRLWVAQREMVLAAGFSPKGEPAPASMGRLTAGALCAGLAASFLLVARGLIEMLAGRRRA